MRQCFSKSIYYYCILGSHKLKGKWPPELKGVMYSTDDPLNGIHTQDNPLDALTHEDFALPGILFVANKMRWKRLYPQERPDCNFWCLKPDYVEIKGWGRPRMEYNHNRMLCLQRHLTMYSAGRSSMERANMRVCHNQATISRQESNNSHLLRTTQSIEHGLRNESPPTNSPDIIDPINHNIRCCRNCDRSSEHNQPNFRS
eukprot:scaffold139999_cov55-Attheya_sp.AAC.1